jgi:type II secretory pathway component GspD/PulD (secretin)
LIENDETEIHDGIPGLSKLPWIGQLFRRKFNRTIKKELIVLLTPRIWDPTTTVLPTKGRSQLTNDARSELRSRVDVPLEFSRETGAYENFPND